MNSGLSGGGKALVLGGGGVTGVAWETGMLMGLADAGLDLAAADVFVGTSAGSVVAAQITSGVPIAKLFEEQITPPSGEIAAHMGLGVTLRFIAAMVAPGDSQKTRARLGHAALRAKTVSEAERHAVIEQRLPSHDWPQQRLLITSINAETGEFVVFDKNSHVSLVDAVGASCAVPLVWPPVTINGKRYIDGGMRTPANVDLAKGYDRVVVIAPLIAAFRRENQPASQAKALGENVRSIIVSPSKAALEAIGRNVLDPAHRVASAQAGHAQASEVAERVREVWLA